MLKNDTKKHPTLLRIIFYIFELFPLGFLLILLQFAKLFAKDEVIVNRISKISRKLLDKKSPHRIFLYRIINEVHPNIRKALFFNLIYRSNYRVFLNRFYGQKDTNIIKKFIVDDLFHSLYTNLPNLHTIQKDNNINIPWLILIDPTTSCNLNCTGCWSAGYGDHYRLNRKTLDRIIMQSKDLGIYLFLFTGGEPLIEKKNLIHLSNKHNDAFFFSFTNGYYINSAFIDEIKVNGNFIPIISIEGNEEETDFRRGSGAYSKAIQAMRLLKQNNIPFGFSICCHAHNVESVVNEQFIKFLEECGAFFGFFFMYVPIGSDASKDFMLDASQRKFMLDNIIKIRKECSLLIIDFWHDAEHVGGCIAGGRKYFHINAKGDCEPCAFVHYSNVNIHNSTILDALKSPLFSEYKLNHPFNDNHLMPCPMTDNPSILNNMVVTAKAKSTHMNGVENVDSLTKKFTKSSIEWEEIVKKEPYKR